MIEVVGSEVPGGGGIDEASDPNLVQQVIAGSHDAVARLYDRHHLAVFAAATRASGDRWVAADVVQETFLALWDRAEQFDPARGSLRAWLQTIAHNRAVDHLRRRERHHRAAPFSSFGTDDAADGPTSEWLAESGRPVALGSSEPLPELAVARGETRDAIADALRTLGPAERTVVELAYGAGLSQSEIANHLGWPIGTVKTRTRRALRLLRERLEPSSERRPCVAVELATVPIGCA